MKLSVQPCRLVHVRDRPTYGAASPSTSMPACILSMVAAWARYSEPSVPKRMQEILVAAVRSRRRTVPSVELSTTAVPFVRACARKQGSHTASRGRVSFAPFLYPAHAEGARQRAALGARSAHNSTACDLAGSSGDRVGRRLEPDAPDDIARACIVSHGIWRARPTLHVYARAHDGLRALLARGGACDEGRDGARGRDLARELRRDEGEVEDGAWHGARSRALGRHGCPDAQLSLLTQQQPCARVARLQADRPRACAREGSGDEQGEPLRRAEL